MDFKKARCLDEFNVEVHLKKSNSSVVARVFFIFFAAHANENTFDIPWIQFLRLLK